MIFLLHSYHRPVCRAKLRVLIAMIRCVLLFPCRNAISALSFPYVYLHCKAFLRPRNLWLDSRYFMIKACTSTHSVFSMYLRRKAIPMSLGLACQTEFPLLPYFNVEWLAHPFVSECICVAQPFHDLRTCRLNLRYFLIILTGNIVSFHPAFLGRIC